MPLSQAQSVAFSASTADRHAAGASAGPASRLTQPTIEVHVVLLWMVQEKDNFTGRLPLRQTRAVHSLNSQNTQVPIGC